ncbi:Na+/H+ antiporter subunit A [Streptomyces sp. HNM0574]|uniref:Na+/H+ antiporter subunit A n=1 Tax=Streptomyces sp. HNM0574 TaxID=2714954 RepID=UPI00146F083D|nr:Na+/H+ antiporter subunit A [Streptomyces sp. HNM0574]
MLLLIVLHFAAACCARPLVRWLGPRAFLALALAPAAATVWAATQYAAVSRGSFPGENHSWMPDLGVSLAFRCDQLSLLMVLIAGGIGALVMLYCSRYFPPGEPRLEEFAGTFTAFAGAMIGLVVADDLVVLYVLWELTTVFSFLLIGHMPEKRSTRLAALQALVVTTLGGLTMLVGFLMLGHEAGTYRISGILANPPEESATVATGLVLVLVGALSKSAVWPFTLWLPGAMAAPTPVSAYLHAAAMVKAGVYLIARLAPAFADVAPWRPLVLVLGSVTLLLGGWRALRETDLKRLLAFGTVSQLGFLTLLTGTGSRDAALAGISMILAHALFKAALFLVVGIVDKATGTRDLNRLSGLGRSRPALCLVAVLAGASMAGLPPLLGFATKEAAVDALLHGSTTDLWTLAAVVAGAALTTAYTLRFLWGAFTRKRTPDGSPRADTPVARIPFALQAPAALCSLAGLLLGPAVSALDPLFSGYADSFASSGSDFHLALWHGFGPALGLSAVSWAVGALAFLGMNALGRIGEQLAVTDGEHVFAHSLWALERLSLQITGGVQRGSLPVYLGTALAVLVGAQGAALAVDRPWQREWDVHWFDSFAQLAVALTVCGVSLLCVMARHRMKAVVLAGVTGYGTGLLYVLHGAPDVALTQFAVETVSIIVFVLVLRRLPARFPERARSGQVRRVTQIVFGVAAGTLAAGLTYVAGTARLTDPVGPELTAATEHDGLKNVVATALVDLRSWDTMGESAVLAVAAVGVTSLVYLRRRSGNLPPVPVPPAGGRPRTQAQAAGTGGPAPPAPGYDTTGGLPVVEGPRTATGGHRYVWPLARPPEKPDYVTGAAPRRTWLAASATLDPERRSVIFEVVARLVFHPIVLLSLYLLFCAENLPGGGFTAGLVAGLALAVRYLAGGRYELAAAAPFDAGFLLGLGLLTMTGTGLAGLFLGEAVLDSGSYDGYLPLIGKFHAASPVLFDTGVYLLVLGVVLDVLRSIGSEVDRRVEKELRRTQRRGPHRPAPAPGGGARRDTSGEAEG